VFRHLRTRLTALYAGLFMAALVAIAIAAYAASMANAERLGRDQLAASGVVFDAFYCNSPLCAPSRFSFLAGRQVSAIGAYDNAAEFPAQVPTFAHYLRRAGYQTVLSGKMHYCGPDQLHGFEERLTTDIASSMERVLKPRGTLVVIEAEHLCMSMRGVKKPGALTVTSAVRGLFRTDAATRAEAMAFIHGGR